MEQPSPGAVKLIAALAGVVALGTLIQAVMGGAIAREYRKGVIDAHQGVGYLIGLVALAAVVVAVTQWRGRVGGQLVLYETAGMFVAAVLEIGLGQQIGDYTKSGSMHPGVLAIHIPLALIIFGLALHLSTFVANLRRARGS